MKKVTIRDIAREAGVSVATVSNVLNGVNKCKAETKQRVEDIVLKLGYKPNISAKTLATRRSGLIGLVVHEDENRHQMSHMNTLINGMNAAIRGHENYDLIITEVFRGGSHEFLKDWITKRDLEGIIFIGGYEEELLGSVEKLSIPMVMVDNYNEEIVRASYIHSEDTLGSYLAVEHLIEKGYKNIAFVSGNLEENEVYRRRFYGYKAAIEEYGLRLTEDYIFQTEEGFSSGYDITSEIIKNKEIDAIFFTYSEGALGSLRYLNKNSVRVPEELGVISFGNLDAWEYTTPSLTSIDQQICHKGKIAVKMMMDKINKNTEYPREISIPVKIIKRETT